MSVLALETLQVAGLLDKNDKAVDVSEFEPKVLLEKLDYYRNTRISQAGKDAETNANASDDLAALVSSVSARNGPQMLLPSCFVYNRLYTNDALTKFARPTSDLSKTHSSWLGMNPDGPPNLTSVTDALRSIELLAPLIRIGALTVLPIEELHAPPTDSLPIFYSEDSFLSEVPEHVRDFVHANAIINEVAPGPEGKGLLIFDHPPKAPTRGIYVRFSDDIPVVNNPFYLLMETEIIEKIDESHLRMAQKLDWDTHPDQELYNAWVNQSVNRTIINRINDVSLEIAHATHLKAVYVTESHFEAELCGMSFDSPRPHSDRITAVNFLNANAPYLRIDDPSVLAKLRVDNPRLFERWQQSLLGIVHELNGADESFEDRAKQLLEKEVRPQIDEINQALIKLRGGIAGSTLLALGTIGFALLSSATLPLAAVLGLGVLGASGKAMPSVAEYLSKRRGPAFVWSKLAK